MGGYASERGGDYYECACGKSTYHSYLTSERGGRIQKCCEEAGWATKSQGGMLYRKRPDQTWDDVMDEERRYREWYKTVDWERYYRDPVYRKQKHEEAQ